MALGNSTADGSVILAKNSDRMPNEGQALLYFPRKNHDPDKDVVKMTYKEIPQVEETFAILMSAPYWLFGCEMGTNEFGVTIGNEAVFTKEPEQDEGLLGMDFIRIALERSKTAVQALDIIIDLLEKYGQGGNCSDPREKKTTYHNSWLIADLHDAWVLETADRFWCTEKVKDIRTISNALTIGEKFDRIHPDTIDYAVKKGYCKSRNDFHFAKAFTSGITDIRTWGAKGLNRHRSTTRILMEKQGSIDTTLMMNILRTHNIKGESNKWNPSKGSFNDICIHCKPIFVISQTTGSLVSHLMPEIQIHWVTGTAAPCTSLFKPVFIESGLPDIGQIPTNEYNPDSLWWQHERVHRAILLDYPARMRIIQPDIQHYEEKWIKQVSETTLKAKSQSPEQRVEILRGLTEEAFEEAQEIEKNWTSDLQKIPINKKSGGIHYRKLWRKENTKAGMEL